MDTKSDVRFEKKALYLLMKTFLQLPQSFDDELCLQDVAVYQNIYLNLQN
ncbi:MAG: hypothetical protein ISQ32_02890 [Rickettsiales bacterium]|nr:hypothetical protein [Rickettsiales bacterium]